MTFYGLEGRHALLTGGSSGITLGIARRFAEEGMKVALVARRPDRLDQAAALIRDAGGTCSVHPADVRDADAMREAVEAAVAAHGPLDVVVAGAAGNFPAAAEALSPNGFKSVIDIDTRGTFHAAHAAFPHLTPGRAVFIAISAPQAQVAYPAQIHANAAKAGVEMIIKTLAVEWGPKGIRSLGISPGPIDKTEGIARLAPTPEARADAVAAVPLKRMGEIEEVAEFAAFLASDRAAYINGQIVAIDGGLSLMSARAVTPVGG